MDDQTKAQKVFHLMYDNDPYSKELGMELKEISPGRCVLAMRVKKHMLNGFSIAHGGISYALCDSALAFAANSYGEVCVSIETSISHTRPVKEDAMLTAETRELNKGKKIRIYEVRVTDDDGKTVALFKGTVYNTGKSRFEHDK